MPGSFIFCHWHRWSPPGSCAFIDVCDIVEFAILVELRVNPGDSLLDYLWSGCFLVSSSMSFPELHRGRCNSAGSNCRLDLSRLSDNIHCRGSRRSDRLRVDGRGAAKSPILTGASSCVRTDDCVGIVPFVVRTHSEELTLHIKAFLDFCPRDRYLAAMADSKGSLIGVIADEARICS